MAASSSSGQAFTIEMQATGLDADDQLPFATHTIRIASQDSDSCSVQFVFIFDTSGSMDSMLTTVTQRVRQLCERIIAHRFTAITYSGTGQCQTTHSATGLPSFRNFGGLTDFKEAFNGLAAVIQEAQSDVVYVFLTDGRHSNKDPVSDTIVSRTNVQQAIEQHREKGFTVTGHALVLGRHADVALSHVLVTPGGHLACTLTMPQDDELYEFFGAGQKQISDVSVILGGQTVWTEQVTFAPDESGAQCAIADVFLPPELAKAKDYVVEIDGERQVVEVMPATFSLTDIAAHWEEIKALPVQQQVSRMVTTAHQVSEWLLLARREFTEVVRAVLGAQTLSDTSRQAQVAGLLTRFENVAKLASKLTFSGVNFVLRPKNDIWDNARLHVTEMLAEHQQAAVAFSESVNQAIVDLAETEARGYEISNNVLQHHAKQAYTESANTKRQARRAKLRLRKLVQAAENSQLFDVAMRVLQSEGSIPDDHPAADTWQCAVSYLTASEAPGGLALEIVRSDAAFDDPSILRVDAVGGFVSFNTFFDMVKLAMDAGRSDGQAVFEADGIGSIGGVLPLALYDKHWDSAWLGFFEQAVGMTVAGDAFGFKSHMAPVLYGKALLAIWLGTRSEVAVDRLFAVVDTMRRMPAPRGGFAKALADFASHRFADDTGGRLDGLVGWAIATWQGTRDAFVEFLGLVWSEMIRRSTRRIYGVERVLQVWDIESMLIHADPLNAPVTSEAGARTLFQHVTSAAPTVAVAKMPEPIARSALFIRSALALRDVLTETDLTDLGYEYGVASRTVNQAFFKAWTPQMVPFDTDSLLLDWAADTFGVSPRAVYWPWIQFNAASTSQARSLGDELATIYNATDELIDATIERVQKCLVKTALNYGDAAGRMLDTHDQMAFAGFVLKFVDSSDPLAFPACGVLSAFRSGAKQPLWKLRILLKGKIPYQIIDGQKVYDVAFSGQKGTKYFTVGPKIVPTRGQRKMIKKQTDKDPDRTISKQSWRRLFGIRDGVPES